MSRIIVQAINNAHIVVFQEPFLAMKAIFGLINLKEMFSKAFFHQ
jgi:hypothetical protein